MKKLLSAACFILLAIAASAQKNLPRIELYAAPGLFFEQLNSDALVPKKEHNHSRLGDDVSFGAVATIATNSSRWLFKGGLGLKQMHYSMAKYNLGDFFVDLFLFDAGPRASDTFALSYVRFTNNYVEVPLSAAYAITRRHKGLPGLAVGINIRPAFLLNSNPDLRVDSFVSPRASPQTVSALRKLYTKDATKTIVTVEPYFEGSFFVYQRLGLVMQLRPFTFYSSKLNGKFTAGTQGILGYTFGVIYDFNR
ncbi:MAG TPA: hypothetical protein VG738_02530 [Chitinophagaceae bacterium]|nr:hypothetical protein [Chitinophagaceae bacterium]